MRTCTARSTVPCSLSAGVRNSPCVAQELAGATSNGACPVTIVTASPPGVLEVAGRELPLPLGLIREARDCPVSAARGVSWDREYRDTHDVWRRVDISGYLEHEVGLGVRTAIGTGPVA